MSDQYLLSLTLIALLGLFVWGKVRYDALAIGALFVLVVLDIIPANQAFAGFAHPDGISFLKKINLFPIKAINKIQIIVITSPT